jgi:hypothetical protein
VSGSPVGAQVVGPAQNPGGEWMKQMARNLLDADDGFPRGKQYLILDRDPLYTKAFRQMLAGQGEAIAVAREEPELERLRGEFCALDQKRMLGSDLAAGRKASTAGHRRVPRHYHGERNHQGLGNVGDDLVRVVAALLPSPPGGVVTYTGPEALTLPETAIRLSRKLGRDIRWHEETADEVQSRVLAQTDERDAASAQSCGRDLPRDRSRRVCGGSRCVRHHRTRPADRGHRGDGRARQTAL